MLLSVVNGSPFTRVMDTHCMHARTHSHVTLAKLYPHSLPSVLLVYSLSTAHDFTFRGYLYFTRIIAGGELDSKGAQQIHKENILIFTKQVKWQKPQETKEILSTCSKLIC